MAKYFLFQSYGVVGLQIRRDKCITEKSGLLQYRKPGDNIMADCSFGITNILPPGVGLHIPPFKGARAQLTAEEVTETVHIASV